MEMLAKVRLKFGGDHCSAAGKIYDFGVMLGAAVDDLRQCIREPEPILVAIVAAARFFSRNGDVD